MTLRQKQSMFAHQVARLIQHAERMGYDLTFGEAQRSKEEAARLAKLGVGIKNSLHCSRLAIDLNLFKDGRYLTTTKAHQPLGEWWEKQSGPGYECCWGGSWGSDGNHYSIEHGGVK